MWVSHRLRLRPRLGARSDGTARVVLAMAIGLVIVALGGSTAAQAEEGPPSVYFLPSTSGDSHEGGLVVSEPGTWEGTTPITFRYQWMRCEGAFLHEPEGCDDIAGATETDYAPVVADIGYFVNLRVTATNGLGSQDASPDVGLFVSARTPSTSESAVITGTADDGETLHLESPGWRGTLPIDFQPQWMRCNEEGWDCHDITGANDADYTLRSGDVGSMITATMRARNIGGYGSAEASPVGPVAAVGPSVLTNPGIYGSLYVGETIATGHGRWSGTSPIEYTVQWQRCDARGESCSNISEATEWSYDVTSEDVSGTVRAAVRATNSVSSSTAYSDAIAAAREDFPRALEQPAISGTLRVGETLSAVTGEWEGAATISYALQWLRCDHDGESCDPISGETSSRYVLRSADFRHTIALRVTASNGAGSGVEESLVSDPVRGPLANTGRFVYIRHGDELWTAAQDGREPTRVLALTFTQQIFEAAISPDGDQIAFVTCNGIELVNSDGSDRRTLVPAPCEEGISFAPSLLSVDPEAIAEPRGVSFTPDGEEVVFSAFSWEDFASRIFKVDTDEGEITSVPTSWESEEWG